MLWCHYSPQTNPNHPHRLGGQQTGPKTFINNEAEGRRTTSDDCVLEIHIYQPESPVHTRLSFPNPQSPSPSPGPLSIHRAHSIRNRPLSPLLFGSATHLLPGHVRFLDGFYPYDRPQRLH